MSWSCPPQTRHPDTSRLQPHQSSLEIPYLAFETVLHSHTTMQLHDGDFPLAAYRAYTVTALEMQHRDLTFPPVRLRQTSPISKPGLRDRMGGVDREERSRSIRMWIDLSKRDHDGERMHRAKVASDRVCESVEDATSIGIST